MKTKPSNLHSRKHYQQNSTKQYVHLWHYPRFLFLSLRSARTVKIRTHQMLIPRPFSLQNIHLLFSLEMVPFRDSPLQPQKRYLCRYIRTAYKNWISYRLSDHSLNSLNAPATEKLDHHLYHHYNTDDCGDTVIRDAGQHPVLACFDAELPK